MMKIIGSSVSDENYIYRFFNYKIVVLLFKKKVAIMSSSGTVKFFNDVKGFGFIGVDGGGDDLFVHRNNVTGGELLEGDSVTFDAVFDDRKQKMRAENVQGGSGGERQFGGYGKGKIHIIYFFKLNWDSAATMSSRTLAPFRTKRSLVSYFVGE